MNMNMKALARLIVYVVAALLGVFITVWGVLHADAGLIATGIGLVTTGGLAGANTPVTTKHAD